MREIRMTMTEPQAEFFLLPDKYPAFVGGFGTGKTEALAMCATRDALESSNALIALYEPTYDLVRLILAPRMEEKLTDLGIRYRYNKTENIIYTSNGGCGDFVLRTLDNPARIVGYESYRAHVDEIDTLKKDQATLAWRKIIARNRQRPRGLESAFNKVAVYTTPEGFNFVYETWGKNPKPGYKMVQAPTRTNPFLPSDYIDSLRASYPPQLIEAYLEGRFVNLNSGCVYPEFSRTLNHAPTVALPGEPLHIGMDFNVNKMAAIVFVVRDDAPHAVGELVKVRDTPEMARLIRDRYQMQGHQITVYPDASGQNTSSKSASQSDLTILQQAGFQILAKSANPPVKDRVNSVNALIVNGQGVRRLRVNTDQCPTFTESLEQQPYDDNGEPDKKTGHDHTNDAGGYFMVWRWPVVKPIATHGAHVPHMNR
ncbi:terminase large subunit domain-containing protein [Chromobacterium violaceum]|uniref:terminase large subunit domain-containing protein n=1 Tax=Chromobacterium violaceum TaxID=536 RepID=UPI00143CE764|nr:terminase family protein [Chromobacterium violaceum]QIY81494.1 terminase [Chromobacterium violaceum]